MAGTIYALATPEGEIRYCGKTVKLPPERMSGHRDSAYRFRSRHVNHWLRSVYDTGAEPKMMVCETVDLDGLDRQQQMAKMNEAERRWIAQLRALGFRLTNATSGGDGGQGRKASEETRQRQSAALKGKKFSAERRAKMREIALRIPKGTYKSGPDNPRFGKPQVWRDPAARIAKILATKAAWSDEQRVANAAKLKGNKHAKQKLTDKQVSEIRGTNLPQSTLAEMYGVSQPNISAIKTGKRRLTQETF